MLESPSLDEILAGKYGKLLTEKTRETAHRDILTFLETRFGEIPREVTEAVTSVSDEEQLRDLVRKAASCPDLDAFRGQIARK